MMTKHQLAEAILALPDDATIRDAIERLEFIRVLEKRIAEAEAHPERMIPHEEVMRRLEGANHSVRRGDAHGH